MGPTAGAAPPPNPPPMPMAPSFGGMQTGVAGGMGPPMTMGHAMAVGPMHMGHPHPAMPGHLGHPGVFMPIPHMPLGPAIPAGGVSTTNGGIPAPMGVSTGMGYVGTSEAGGGRPFTSNCMSTSYMMANAQQQYMRMAAGPHLQQEHHGGGWNAV